MRHFALRSHYWGALLVIVVMGEVESDGAAAFASSLANVPLATGLLIDLVDAKSLDPGAVEALGAARQRSEGEGWGFAVVCDPDGACAKAIRASEHADGLKIFRTRQEARAALQS
jgi:anti-anti-sigma regulatory factor